MLTTVFRAAAVIAATFLLHGCNEVGQPAGSVAPSPQATSQVTSAPATRPAAMSQPVRVTVKETRRKEDTASITWEDGVAVVSVTSRSGIGSMTLAIHDRNWPAKVLVRLQYEAGRPFRSLEMFGAALGRGADKDSPKVDHRIVKSPRGVSVELTPPEGKGLHELKLSWIDAYRH